jgi:hypothetical protein
MIRFPAGSLEATTIAIVGERTLEQVPESRRSVAAARCLVHARAVIPAQGVGRRTVWNCI